MIFKAEMEISAKDVIELGSKLTDVINFFENLEKKARRAKWESLGVDTSKCNRCGHIAKTPEEKTYFCPDCGSPMENPHT